MTTINGVMVQVHSSEPTDAEWTKMLDRMIVRKGTLKAVLGGQTAPPRSTAS